MTLRSRGADALGLGVSLLVSYAAAALGAWASANAPTFYAQLAQPTWAPPASLFGPVWSALFTLMGIAAWLVWRAPGPRATALVLFGVQLAFNALWSWLFFAWRLGAAATVEVVLLAALVAATILRKNRTAEVLCFDTAPRTVALERRDSIMTNAKALAAVGGGGTNVSAALEALVKRGAAPDLVVLLSDNESWIDAKAGVSAPTPTMIKWNALRAKNPRAKLVCVDLAPNEHTQAIEREDILNVGGFSDQVFGVIDAFARGALGKDHWLGVIDAVTL